jgi:ribosome-binding ATPase
VNIAESDLSNFATIESQLSSQLGKPVSAVCAKLEYEMLEMDEEDRAMFLEDYGVDPHTGPTLNKLIKLAFDTVGLMYYFTTGVKETRAWTIPLVSTAPQAA